MHDAQRIPAASKARFMGRTLPPTARSGNSPGAQRWCTARLSAADTDDKVPPMSAVRILVVHRESAYSEAAADGAQGRVKGLLDRRDPLVADLVRAHERHAASMERIRGELDARHLDATWRHDWSDLCAADFDLVIAIGGDGTVLHASHSIGDTPVLAINSSPETSRGYFTAGGAAEMGALLDGFLGGALEATPLHRMEVRVNGEVIGTRILNDALFSHLCPASTTRYELQIGDAREEQLSSGVWVCTAAGSTAVVRAAGGKEMRPGSRRLQFVVREPSPVCGPHGMRWPELVKGLSGHDCPISIRSKTSAARLYLDGPHLVHRIDFGDVVTFGGAARPLRLLGYRTQKKP
jgi:NAD+ kinase